VVSGGRCRGTVRPSIVARSCVNNDQRDTMTVRRGASRKFSLICEGWVHDYILNNFGRVRLFDTDLTVKGGGQRGEGVGAADVRPPVSIRK
jgi:hypothetical protein